MSALIGGLLKGKALLSSTNKLLKIRTFLSEAYYCKEVWQNRLNSPLLTKINLDELYFELDQKFQKTRQISALDVDIFVNAVDSDIFSDEAVDLVHKLRLSAETCNTLESTGHAVVRILMNSGKYEELLNVLSDRLNYGVFLDFYMANLLMDTFWKQKQYAHGANVASQLMLQDEPLHPLSAAFSLLHCYNYLLDPKGWLEAPKVEEPEEEVKIRVKYLRNKFDDEHFSLKEPNKLIGKTILYVTKQQKPDGLTASFNILANFLLGKQEQAKELLNNCKNDKIVVYQELIDLIPKDSYQPEDLNGLQIESRDLSKLLQDNVKLEEKRTSEKDIGLQYQIYSEWDKQRIATMNTQRERLSKVERLENVDNIKKKLKERETELWFFENEENIELGIEAKKIFYPKRWFGKKKKPRKLDETYVPPEVRSKFE